MEASLGLRNFTDVFTLLVDEPVAAASIGQVHLAPTYAGDRVVVKAIYPEIEGTSSRT